VFARRAEHIRSGPAWPSADDAVRRFRPRRPARRWLLPAAAAAVVATLVVTVIAVRGLGSPADHASPGPAGESTTSGPGVEGADDDRLPPAPTPVAQQPIPAGQQAVDALGVEIFVPTSLTVDPPCASKSVSRPAYGLTYAIGCIPVQAPALDIMTATNAADGMTPTTGPCAGTVELDGENGCIRIQDADSSGSTIGVSVLWPRHDVALIADYPSDQRAQALAVFKSAHRVSVDRHGCAATRFPVVPAGASSLPEGSVLPADATSTSACWYSSGRLVASATLPSPGSSRDLEHPGAPGSAPGIGSAPSYSPSPDGESCSALGRTEGIVFQSTQPDGSIAVSAAQFADCTGGQYWTDGKHAQPVDEALASAVRGLAGFLLVFGYHAQPLDAPTSSASPAPASDLPATTGPDDTSASTTPVTDNPVTGSSVTAADQLPIPDGKQAVDALGVEIFVSKSLALDPRCDGKSVSRPAYGLTDPHGGSCVAEQPPIVTIMTAMNAAAGMVPTTGPCMSRIELDGEQGCARIQDPDSSAISVIWPQHNVAVTANYGSHQSKEALAVLESAHWVPTDRHGCAAARSPVVPTDAASLPEGSVLPADVASTSVCWYSGGRLVASATLPSTATKSLRRAGVLIKPTGAGTTPSHSSPGEPACSTLGRTEGIVFRATRPDGTIAVSAAQFADCTGGQFWTDGTRAQPIDEALAWTIHSLAGFLLSFGYRAQPLDSVASTGAAQTASDLPTTLGREPAATPWGCAWLTTRIVDGPYSPYRRLRAA
jgi:hypothetical protein